MKPKLYLMCGLPGSGKTKFARNFNEEKSGIVFSSDEWLIKMFGRNFPPAQFKDKQTQAREAIDKQAEKTIKQGKDVILDFGFWKREDRKKYIEKGKSWGAEVVIYYFTKDFNILLERLMRRGENLPNDALVVSEEMLLKFSEEFEPPGESETEIVIIS